MKDLMGRGLALLLCSFVVAGLFGVPSASAQFEEQTESLDTGETLKTERRITDEGDQTVVTETLTAADGCTATITTTTETLEVAQGALALRPDIEYPGVADLLPARRNLVTTVTQELAQLPCSPPLTDEVQGVVVTPDDLAFTGSNVDMPLVAGAAMIGLGGILVAVSKRRHDDDS